MNDSLFERIGGAGAVELAVSRLYDRALTDPLLSPAFAGVDMGRLRGHMTRYVGEAFGDGDRLARWDLAAAHAGLHITERMFEAVVIHLASVLEDLGVEPALVDDAIARLARHRDAVVTVPSPERLPGRQETSS